MNEAALRGDEVAASVMAVPPLARHADYTLSPAENLKHDGHAARELLALERNFA